MPCGSLESGPQRDVCPDLWNLHVTFDGKRCFADGIKLKTLSWRDCLGLPGGALSSMGVCS